MSRQSTQLQDSQKAGPGAIQCSWTRPQVWLPGPLHELLASSSRLVSGSGPSVSLEPSGDVGCGVGSGGGGLASAERKISSGPTKLWAPSCLTS